MSGSPDSALFWEHMVFVGLIPIPALYYHFVLLFLSLSQRRRPLLVAACALAAVFMILNATPLFITLLFLAVQLIPFGLIGYAAYKDLKTHP